MKPFALALAILCLGAAMPAQAQTASSTSSTDRKIFVEVDGGLSFSGRTSTVEDVQVGYTYKPKLVLFAEAGRLQNVASNAISESAGVITSYLTTQGYGVASSSVKVPVTFGALGARYGLPRYFGFRPYVLLAIGLASVKNNTRFSVNGTDISGQMLNYGVQLGSDLSGTQTAALFSMGGGATFPLHAFFIDASARYAHFFTSPSGLNVGIAYLGLGYRF